MIVTLRTPFSYPTSPLNIDTLSGGGMRVMSAQVKRVLFLPRIYIKTVLEPHIIYS